ncbi:MAG TPA: RluA family pseudouridine synthase, partial [Cellvibrionaceae bacterium]|nr:RluA family pseudouridine synthase [Cellvibrionaceae bacterium]
MAGGVTVQYFQVTDNEDGQRLDNYLLSRLKGAPKSLVYRVIRKGEVRVNKGRVQPDTRLKTGDSVRVPPMRLSQEQAVVPVGEGLKQHLLASIIYDANGLLVVNKPSGLAVHGGSGVSLGLIESLRQLPGNQGYLELVHRLDRETSGLVMVARKRSVLTYLQNCLRERGTIQKTYLALVQGLWPKHRTQVNAPLLKSGEINQERFVKVAAQGKPSLTEFNIVHTFAQCTLVEAKPITGRTHQIRVHAQYAGCPLIGDEKYGLAEVNSRFRSAGCRRLFLHAARLDLVLPDGAALTLEAPLPEDLTAVLRALDAFG